MPQIILNGRLDVLSQTFEARKRKPESFECFNFCTFAQKKKHTDLILL